MAYGAYTTAPSYARRACSTFAPRFRSFGFCVRGSVSVPLRGNSRGTKANVFFFHSFDYFSSKNWCFNQNKIGFELQFLQPLVFILKRIFPFHRGIYEDYVANVWVALSPVIKVNAIAKRSLYAQSVVLRCCTLATALAFIPSCVLVFQKPSFGR